MNKIYYTILLLLQIIIVKAQKQEITFENLLACSNMPSESFTRFVKHKGFKTITDSSMHTGYTFLRTNKDKSLRQVIGRRETKDTVVITFQTTNQLEFSNWQQELQKIQFSLYKDKSNWEQNAKAYQKRNFIVKLGQSQYGDITLYNIILESKKLLPSTEIQYAEDLLLLNTHEYLVAVFGESNVKKDLFYFSEQEVNKCSILFPNTSNQVIFIWNDEENRGDIAFLILGGQANQAGSTSIFNGNQFHKWRSKQGIYLGMPLRELQTLNGKPIEFYGWDSDQPGFVVKKNTGRINFNHLGIQLQCLECYKDESKVATLSSEKVLNANDRVLVNSLIILPERELRTNN